MPYDDSEFLNPGDPGYEEAKAKREARWNGKAYADSVEKAYDKDVKTKTGNADRLWDKALGEEKKVTRNADKAYEQASGAVKTNSITGKFKRLSSNVRERVKQEAPRMAKSGAKKAGGILKIGINNLANNVRTKQKSYRETSYQPQYTQQPTINTDFLFGNNVPVRREKRSKREQSSGGFGGMIMNPNPHGMLGGYNAFGMPVYETPVKTGSKKHRKGSKAKRHSKGKIIRIRIE